MIINQSIKVLENNIKLAVAQCQLHDGLMYQN